VQIKIKWIKRKQMTHENTYRDDNNAWTQLRTISMILTVTFDNKFDQIDEADCMFIFQIKHQYSF
jgi:hypothetical protein